MKSAGCVVVSVILLLLHICLYVRGGRNPFSSLSSASRTTTNSAPFIIPSPSCLPNPAEGLGHLIRARLPPILLLVLFGNGVEPAEASPLNPQNPFRRLTGPFFQGWLVRTTDHDSKRSFIFIVGSFSAARDINKFVGKSGSGAVNLDKIKNGFSEHYVFFCVCEHGIEMCHEECFPDPETVVISGGAAGRPSLLGSTSATPLNITWSAEGIGKFVLTEETCKADFIFRKSGTRLRFETRKRLPWSTQNLMSGPEGWLGYTSLLPCHYMVHSTGSPTTYDIEQASSGKDLVGQGYSHIEGNHGNAFPAGWTWSQAVAKDNRESFSFVAGRFEIGGIRPLNVILYLRTRNGNRVFRTTDLDDIKISRMDKSGYLSLTAISRRDRFKVELTIACPPGSFGRPVFIPTIRGFSNEPGARESYVAVATFRCSTFDTEANTYILGEEIRFEQTCLEFGNQFS